MSSKRIKEYPIVSRDASQRPAAENNNNIYRTLIDNLPQKVFCKDLQSVYISCNKNYADDLKITPEKIVGKTDYDFYPEELAEKYRSDDQRILNSGIPEEIEEQYQQNGQTIYVNTVKAPIKDTDGNIVGLVGIFWDISNRRMAEEELKNYRDHLQNLVKTKTSKLSQLNSKLKKEIQKHKRIENELRQSEEKLRIMFEFASDAITVLDMEGKIKDLNNGALRLHNYDSKAELLGHNALELIAPQDHLRVKENFRKTLKSGMTNAVEFSYLTRDGMEFQGEMSASVLKDKLGIPKGVFTITRNITERKKEEAQLRLRAELLNNANDAVFVLDLQNLTYIYANRTACKMHGYTMDEFLQLKHEQLVCPTEDHADYVKETIKQKGDAIFETAHFRKDGSALPLEIHIKYFEVEDKTLLLCIARDITLRKEHIAELQNREHKLKSLMDTSLVGISWVNSSTGAIEYVNQKFVELFGYELKEIPTIDQWFTLALHNTAHIQDFRARQQSGDFPRTGKPLETIVTCKDGTLRCVEVATSAVGQYIFAIHNDITERKRAEEKLESANKQMIELVGKLKDRNRQNKILGEMRDLLNICSSIAEIPPIIVNSIEKLFPFLDGALFLLSPSRSDLESVATWGDFPSDIEDNIFEPDACWSLRRGNIYLVEDIESGPICNHLKHMSSTSYACMPLMAKGDVLGLLHLRSKKTAPTVEAQKDMDMLAEIASTVSEYLSLSISNIKLRETLANQSIRDSLTNLYNRRYMEEATQHEIMRAERKQNQIGIIMLDIDHFKNFNDSYGHKAGDALLVQLANFLKASLRGSDVICRYGGDEFIIIMPESSVGDSFQRAEQLRQEVKKMPTYYRDQMLPSITLSVGIATYPLNGRNIDELLNTADTALYRAKAEGRDKVVIG